MANYFDAGGHNENSQIVRSKRVNGVVAEGTHGMIRIPKNAFLIDAWIEKHEALVPSGALDLSLGIAGNKETADPDYLMINADIDGANTGIERASLATTPFEGKRFTEGSGMITLTCGSGSDLTAGSFTVIAEYYMLHG